MYIGWPMVSYKNNRYFAVYESFVSGSTGRENGYNEKCQYYCRPFRF